MDKVIRLEDLKRSNKPLGPPPNGTAEIVLFHGVRVERLTDEMVAAEMAEKKPARRIASLNNQATARELE